MFKPAAWTICSRNVKRKIAPRRKRVSFGDISGNGGKGPKFKLASNSVARRKKLEEKQYRLKPQKGPTP